MLQFTCANCSFGALHFLQPLHPGHPHFFAHGLLFLAQNGAHDAAAENSIEVQRTRRAARRCAMGGKVLREIDLDGPPWLPAGAGKSGGRQEASRKNFPYPSFQSVSPPGWSEKKNRYDFFDVTDDGLTKIGDCRGRAPTRSGRRAEGMSTTTNFSPAEAPETG